MLVESANATSISRVPELQSYPGFDGHEKVFHCRDEQSGLLAYVALHNCTLGNALGGCRMWPYANEAEAIQDVLRLSQGMTLKHAIAGTRMGAVRLSLLATLSEIRTRSCSLLLRDSSIPWMGNIPLLKMWELECRT